MRNRIIYLDDLFLEYRGVTEKHTVIENGEFICEMSESEINQYCY